MNAQFDESYSKLSDMKPGDVAVSKDRDHFYICGYDQDQEKVTLEINNLSNQYLDKTDTSQPVKILKQGDRFSFEL
jgi:hypothetical protein